MAKFLLAFACVTVGLRDFKAEPCWQVADFTYSISVFRAVGVLAGVDLASGVHVLPWAVVAVLLSQRNL